jgi:hypothetical protein
MFLQLFSFVTTEMGLCQGCVVIMIQGHLALPQASQHLALSEFTDPKDNQFKETTGFKPK